MMICDRTGHGESGVPCQVYESYRTRLCGMTSRRRETSTALPRFLLVDRPFDNARNPSQSSNVGRLQPNSIS